MRDFSKFPAAEFKDTVLAPLFASLDGPTLQRLNAQIALEGQDARKVAEAHLKAKGLIP